jgi:hypothetical protein
MLKAARSYQSIPESATSSEKSESHPLIPIALFSGIGLLVSLIAILMDSPGAWYYARVNGIFCKTSPPPRFGDGGRRLLPVQAAWRLVAACNAPASAFSRCSGPIWIPSAEMNSGLATPMKPNTQRK